MTKEHFHQGAKVRRYILEPTSACSLNERKSRERQSEAYKLAITNQHKTWARRWLKERRYV